MLELNVAGLLATLRRPAFSRAAMTSRLRMNVYSYTLVGAVNVGGIETDGPTYLYRTQKCGHGRDSQTAPSDHLRLAGAFSSTAASRGAAGSGDLPFDCPVTTELFLNARDNSAVSSVIKMKIRD
jgi:hypothetical protein